MLPHRGFISSPDPRIGVPPRSVPSITSWRRVVAAVETMRLETQRRSRSGRRHGIEYDLAIEGHVARNVDANVTEKRRKGHANIPTRLQDRQTQHACWSLDGHSSGHHMIPIEVTGRPLS